MPTTQKKAPRRRGFRIEPSPEPPAAQRKPPPPRRKKKLAENGHAAADTIGDDLLRGAAAISHFLGWSLYETRHSLARGHLPATKCGLYYIGSKRRLRAHFQGEEAGET